MNGGFWVEDDVGLKEVVDINRSQIEAEEDEQELRGWYLAMVDAADVVSTQLAAYREAGTATDDWLHRAGALLARAKLSLRWVERRMLYLKYRVPYPPNDPRTKEIGRLAEENRKLKNRVFQLENPTEKAA